MKYCGLLVFLACSLTAQLAFTDAQEEAKEHYLKGKALVDEGACDKAVIELEASYKLNPIPIVLYNIAVCYDELHKYALAANFFRKFLMESKDVSEEIKQQVTARIQELNKFLGWLALEVDVDGAEVIIDGSAAGFSPLGKFFVETGEHEILVKKENLGEKKEKFTIISGDTTTVKISLTPGTQAVEEGKEEKAVEKEPKTGQKGPRKKLGVAPFYSAVGITGAAAIIAIITGSVTLKKANKVEGLYENENWKPTYDEGKRFAVATDVLIAVAAVGAASAVVLIFFTDFKKEKKNTACISPSGIKLAF